MCLRRGGGRTDGEFAKSLTRTARCPPESKHCAPSGGISKHADVGPVRSNFDGLTSTKSVAKHCDMPLWPNPVAPVTRQCGSCRVKFGRDTLRQWRRFMTHRVTSALSIDALRKVYSSVMLGAPCQCHLLARQDHGRTMPLADIRWPLIDVYFLIASLSRSRTWISGSPLVPKAAA
jgi:hypothetical protein